jgi:O-antigen/teichoic acid export membrane protein
MTLKTLIALSKQSNFRKYFSNTSWLLGERIFRMGVSLFVGIYVARYLGPERFGLLSYANSFVALFTAVATLGLDGVVVRELVKLPEQRDTLLGTSFVLKIAGALVMWLMILITIFFANNNFLTNTLIAIIAFGVIFQALNVIDFAFQAEVKSKYVVYTHFVQLVFSSIIKLALVISNFPLIWFAVVYCLDAFILAFGLVYIYLNKHGAIKIWKWDSRIATRLLLDSWPLMFSYMSYLMYAKIDRIMIKEMLDEYSVGVYSAAYVIYEAPLFISLMLAKSVYPLLVEYFQENKYKLFNYYKILSSYMTLLSYMIVLFIYIFHEVIIQLTFGDDFEDSSKILVLLSFGLIPMFNACLRSSYITISGNQRIILYTTLFSSIVNIILNYLLINIYGVAGAAYATVSTQILSLFLLNIVFLETRVLFFIQAKSLSLTGIWSKY